jgi:hypothetical protein
MNQMQKSQGALSTGRILATWWPLAGSWLLMAAEQPVMSAIVARLVDPEINLAAWGGIVFPLILIIESPIIMLLSASTALSKDWDSYLRIRRFMMWAGGALTVLHILVAFTPLYYVVVRGILHSPEEIIEPARLGMMIITPWTWSIAYRRFNQGVMIRFGHPRAVALGTLIRLMADAVVLIIGYLAGTVAGIVVASGAIAAGVVCEAIYAGLRVRPVLHEVRLAPPVDDPLTVGAFLGFYLPLAATSLLNLLVQPIGSAALGRMPDALASLAVWPVVSGFIFLLRSLGVAYNEVVIALLDEPGAARQLRRFTVVLTVFTTALMLLFAATPLGTVWFREISALPEHLLALATQGLAISVLLPGLNVLQSWYQGAIVVSRRTRGITEALGIFLIVTTGVMWLGVMWGGMTGLYVGLIGFTVGSLAHTAWLWSRSGAVRARFF